jgi:ribosome-associated protein
MDNKILADEINYRSARSSGSGGQHVNKVETKVDLLFDLNKSKGLTEAEKALAGERLQNRLTTEGMLVLSCQTFRSQAKNKAQVTARFFDLMEKALAERKTRKPSKTPLSVIARRRRDKQLKSEKKAWRRGETWK